MISWFSFILSIIWIIAIFSRPLRNIYHPIFMHPRILAILILLISLIVPLGLYWYFYESRVTSLIFESDKESPFTVELEGTLSYTYFPLLDTAFSYRSICTKSCIFSPIPPLRYTVRISSSGSEDLWDDVSLTTGESRKYPVYLAPACTFTSVASFALSDIPEWSIGKNQNGDLISLRTDISGWMSLYNSKKEGSFFQSAFAIQSARLDASRNYVILRSPNEDQYIVSLDEKRNTIFPLREEIDMISFEEVWKVRTKSDLYEYLWSTWQKNPRFTDYIDISSRYRIGYIDRSDTVKLSLGNLPLWESLFILLDRTSTDARIIKRWKNIRGFLFYRGAPSILDLDGTVSRIDIDVRR